MQTKEKLFVFSLLSLNIFQWISVVEFDYGIHHLVKYLFSVFAIGALFYYQYTHPVDRSETNIYHPVIIFFLIWSGYLLIEGAFGFNDIFYVQRVFGQQYFYLPYLLPLIILYTRFDIYFFGYLLKAVSALIILSVIVQLYVMGFNLGDPFYENFLRIGLFDVGSGLLLLMAHFSSKKQVSYIIIFYFLLFLFLYAHFGRRGLSVKTILFLVAMVIIRLKSPLALVRDRMITYFYILLTGMFVFVLFEPVLSSAYVFQRGFDTASLQASRERVFEDFFFDFDSNKDWLFGRGLDGEILRTIAEEGTGDLIENGFLTVLLKGGLLYLIPMLIIMLRACYLGFFKSNNDLGKALAALVFIQIISMMMHGLPDYSSPYVLVWVAVAGCFSSVVREPDNEEVFLIMNADTVA